MTTTTVSAIIILTDAPDPVASDLQCSAFLACDNRAIGWVRCANRTWIPCCARCARTLDYALRYQCLACGNFARPGDALTAYLCGEPAPFGVECLNCAEEGHVASCGSCHVAEREASED